MASTKVTKVFSDRLSDLLQKAKADGQDIRKVSKATGVPTGSISAYANDSQQASISNVCALADYFDVSVDFLLGRTADPSRQPCATDDLHLSPAAVALIRLADYEVHNKGLNMLLEDARFHSLCEWLGEFQEEISEAICVSKKYESTAPGNDFYSDHWKLRRAGEEFSRSEKMQEQLHELFPEHQGKIKVLLGGEHIEYQKQFLSDLAEDILCFVSGYHKFRNGFYKASDLYK